MRKIRNNYLLLLTVYPPFSRKFFLLFVFVFGLVRTRYSSHDISSQLDLSKTLSLATLTTVNNMIMPITITFTVLIFRVIAKRLSSRSCLKFRGGNDDRNQITEVIFLRHFVCLFFARRPRKKCLRVSHEMVQFVLKIAHLAISMEPTPLLEKVSSHGLLPRLWLLAKHLFCKCSYLSSSLPLINSYFSLVLYNLTQLDLSLIYTFR